MNSTPRSSDLFGRVLVLEAYRLIKPLEGNSIPAKGLELYQADRTSFFSV